MASGYPDYFGTTSIGLDFPYQFVAFDGEITVVNPRIDGTIIDSKIYIKSVLIRLNVVTPWTSGVINIGTALSPVVQVFPFTNGSPVLNDWENFGVKWKRCDIKNNVYIMECPIEQYIDGELFFYANLVGATVGDFIRTLVLYRNLI